LPGDMCGIVSSCSELLSLFLLVHTFPSTSPFEPTHSLSDGMGRNWLFFLILYQLYTALFIWLQKYHHQNPGGV
jgi:uncharacterized membrane protein (DUF373 family)